ncbi:undecaprenyldiphospho-muramoylpentapeptide beta-N-acetylglucosaminyltransferase [Parabacteroides sp. Marseille-P3160]|uniref:undecaprenyldiphospho-muramoylpentapeptide beta-N-acetylglucosaminyltransferase n=1 Tax=Parabacteroides sp. Marseille-P3160 TaxID=1917887 RepID=UPI0009BB7097|nr:undecaprenyldiphospho-muramoylpentapeptide beta-N-acetylglucosaminyltransferase [Parabacteroides sp. Marseille-P3160]
MSSYRIIISGGGTGGHIFPAVAIANTFKRRFPDAEILFVGAEDRMEMEKVPAAGYKIIGLPVKGFDRSHLFANVSVLLKLFKSLNLARQTVRSFQPDIVIGVGGYASGPTLWAATSFGIPTLIQEQNSYAGVTNKLLAKRVSKICVAYEGMERFFPADKIVLTGNPVRPDLEEALDRKEAALAYFSLSPGKKTLLVVGGSLGARTINQSIETHLNLLLEAGIQIIWQTGRYYKEQVQTFLKDFPKDSIWCSDFISRMDYAYAAADLVVSRAGASSISELCLLKKPAILVPSPNVAEDHQTKNARSVADKGGAILIADADAREQLVPKAVETLSDDTLLQSLSKQIALLGKPHSAENIVDEIVRIIDKERKDKNGSSKN